MPTGYTYVIVDNKDITAKQYIENIAKAFFYECRDGGEIKKQADDYDSIRYFNDVQKHKKDLHELSNLSDEQIQQLKEVKIKKLSDKVEYYKEMILKNAEQIQSYKNMVNKIEKLDFPDELKNMKEFALSQLNKSLDYDNMQQYYHNSSDKTRQEIHELTIKKNSEFIKDMQSEISETVSFYEKRYNDALEKEKLANNFRKTYFDFIASIST